MKPEEKKPPVFRRGLVRLVSRDGRTKAAKREMLEEIRVSPKNLWVVLYISPVFLAEVDPVKRG